MTAADPDYGYHYSRTPPEELLIYAVLSRAILDLFGPIGLVSHRDEIEVARSEALYFLTRETGAWAKRRNELCEAIGFDGDIVRSRVVRVLEGDTKALDTYESRGALTHVGEARRLWELEKRSAERSREASRRAKEHRKINAGQPQHKVNRYSDVRDIILPLLDKPHTMKELIIATNGDVSDTAIRKILNNALEKGEIVRDPTTHQYQVVPQTEVAAAAA